MLADISLYSPKQADTSALTVRLALRIPKAQSEAEVGTEALNFLSPNFGVQMSACRQDVRLGNSRMVLVVFGGLPAVRP